MSTAIQMPHNPADECLTQQSTPPGREVEAVHVEQVLEIPAPDEHPLGDEHERGDELTQSHERRDGANERLEFEIRGEDSHGERRMPRTLR